MNNSINLSNSLFTINRIVRKSLYLIILILFIMSFVNAYSSSQNDFTKSFGVQFSDSTTPIFKREIFLKLTPDYTIYQDSYHIKKDNINDMIGFSLPQNKEFVQLNIFDLSLSEKRRYIEVNDIKSIDNCEGYYQLEKINNTYLILLCPFHSYLDKIIMLESFLYNDLPCGNQIKEGLFFFTLNELEIFPTQKDLYFKLSAIVDSSLFSDRTIQDIKCGNDSEIHYLGNGVVCEGNINLPEGSSRQIKLTLGGQNKDIIAKKDFEKQLNEQWEMTNVQIRVAMFGILLAILIALFSEEFKKCGGYIIKLFKSRFIRNNKMRRNNKELIRIEWENHRTYAFALFASSLVIAFGVISNIDKINRFSLVIFILTFVVLIIGFWISFSNMRKKFQELKDIFN